MIGIERDILLLISRVRCMTESQAGKVFGTRKKYGRKPFKKTLKKMCNEYTLRKYPCSINYHGYRDSSGVYYLNGSTMYKGKDLLKVLIGSELAIKISVGGYEVKRFYRNVKVGTNKYDIFVEYLDNYNELKQILVDIDVGEEMDMIKYSNINIDIDKSTIPFYTVPKVLVITSSKPNNFYLSSLHCDINFVDPNLNKLFTYI
ncbi:MAG: hypothetical protein RRZ84_03615 [Romboutsia sp.]